MSDPIGPNSQFGKYRIVKSLGSGGMAHVWEAIDTSLLRPVAIKLFPNDLTEDSEQYKRFRKEVLAVAALDHPGIVTIFEVGELQEHQFYTMTLIPGGNLKERIHDGKIGPRRALEIVRQCALALQHAHERGIIHRDIKPENILFTTDDQPVLGDFGIAKVVGASTVITAMGTAVGTPFYMSPEQSDIDLPVDHRTDIYSLGVVLFEMLCRRVPYRAATPVQIALKHFNDPIPRLPPALSAIQPMLDRMLAKRAQDRYPDAQSIIADIDLIKHVPFPDSVSDGASEAVVVAAQTEFELMGISSEDNPVSDLQGSDGTVKEAPPAEEFDLNEAWEPPDPTLATIKRDPSHRPQAGPLSPAVLKPGTSRERRFPMRAILLAAAAVLALALFIWLLWTL